MAPRESVDEESDCGHDDAADARGAGSGAGAETRRGGVPGGVQHIEGTSIDCIVTAIEDGRYKVEVTLEDSSIDTGIGTGTATATGANTTAPHPAFRSFRTNDTVTLRDGQSAQSFTATDKVNGEVWKVDVTLSVVK